MASFNALGIMLKTFAVLGFIVCVTICLAGDEVKEQ